MVSKMTKRDVKERHRAKDERELFFSMKVSLDLLMKANVKDPEVVGLLVRGNVSLLIINVVILLWYLGVDIYHAFPRRLPHRVLYAEDPI
jgi:hypothetical protein